MSHSGLKSERKKLAQNLPDEQNNFHWHLYCLFAVAQVALPYREFKYSKRTLADINSWGAVHKLRYSFRWEGGVPNDVTKLP